MKSAILIGLTALASFTFELKSSFPGKDSLIDDPPLKVALKFSEAVIPESSTIEFLHRDTTAFFSIVVRGTTRPDSIEAVVPRKLLGGHYLLKWKTMTKDFKRQTGMYAFIVDVPE